MELWFTEKHADQVGFTLKVKETLYSAQSKYQRIDIFDTYFFGRVLTLDGIVMTTERDEFIYHEMISHQALFVHKAPERVLIIGGGDGGTAREVLKHPVKEVVMCEIDEMVVEACKKYLPTIASALNSNDPRFKLVIGDGIEFVKGCKEEFDVIIIDSSDPIGPAEGLFSVDFYRNCKKALREGGIVVNQSESPFYEMYLVKSIRQNLLDAGFRYVNFYYGIIPSYPSSFWTWGFASDTYDPLRDYPTQKKFDIKTKYFHPELGLASFMLPRFFYEEIEEK